MALLYLLLRGVLRLLRSDGPTKRRAGLGVSDAGDQGVEDEAPALLRFLAGREMMVGAEVEAVALDLGAGVLTVKAGGRPVPMALEKAGKVWVEWASHLSSKAWHDPGPGGRRRRRIAPW